MLVGSSQGSYPWCAGSSPATASKFLTFKTNKMAVSKNKTIAAEAVTDEMIAEWKAKYGSVFKFEVDDKVAYFKSPDRKIVGASTTASDNVAGNEMIANNCFLAGDEIILTDDGYFYSLSRELLPKMIKSKVGKSMEL